MSKQLTDLATLAAELNKVRDEHRAAIEEFERLVNSTHVGIATTLLLDGIELTFARHNNSWRVFYNGRLAAHCTALERATVVHALPQLLDAIVRAAQDRLARLRSTS